QREVIVDAPTHKDLMRTLTKDERDQQLLDLALLAVVAQAQPSLKAAQFDLTLRPILRLPVLQELTITPYGDGRIARLTDADDPLPEYVAIVPPATAPNRAVPGLSVNAKALYDLVDDRLLDIRLGEPRGIVHVVKVRLGTDTTPTTVQYDGA